MKHDHKNYKPTTALARSQNRMMIMEIWNLCSIFVHYTLTSPLPTRKHSTHLSREKGFVLVCAGMQQKNEQSTDSLSTPL